MARKPNYAFERNARAKAKAAKKDAKRAAKAAAKAKKAGLPPPKPRPTGPTEPQPNAEIGPDDVLPGT